MNNKIYMDAPINNSKSFQWELEIIVIYLVVYYIKYKDKKVYGGEYIMLGEKENKEERKEDNKLKAVGGWEISESESSRRKELQKKDYNKLEEIRLFEEYLERKRPKWRYQYEVHPPETFSDESSSDTGSSSNSEASIDEYLDTDSVTSLDLNLNLHRLSSDSLNVNLDSDTGYMYSSSSSEISELSFYSLPLDIIDIFLSLNYCYSLFFFLFIITYKFYKYKEKILYYCFLIYKHPYLIYTINRIKLLLLIIGIIYSIKNLILLIL